MSFHIRVDAESVCISLRDQGRASPIKVLRRSHSEVVVTRWHRRQSHDARSKSGSAIVVTRWDRRQATDSGRKCRACKKNIENRRHEQECVLDPNRGSFEAKEHIDDDGDDDSSPVTPTSTARYSTSVFDKLVCVLKYPNRFFSSPVEHVTKNNLKPEYFSCSKVSENHNRTKGDLTSNVADQSKINIISYSNSMRGTESLVTLKCCSSRGAGVVLTPDCCCNRGTEIIFTSTTRDDKKREVTGTSNTDKNEKVNVLTANTLSKATLSKTKELRTNSKRDSVDFCRDPDVRSSVAAYEATPASGKCQGCQDVRAAQHRLCREKQSGMHDVVPAPVFSETFKRTTDFDADVIVPPEARGASPLPTTTGVPPNPAVQPQHDVYIAHAREDLKVATRLLRVMEERGFSCFMCERDFPVGDCISDVITDAVRSSRHVVPVVSKSFLSKDWGMFKLHASLSWMYETNRALLLPVLVDVCDEDVPRFLRHLSYVDMRSDPDYVDKLISMLQGPEVRVNELLPVGNLSYGIVYNYYLGYLRFVLPGIQQRIDRWCQQHSKARCFDARMSRKLYILVPVSCYCPHTLMDASRAVSFGGHVEDLVLSRAGSLRRVYRHTVWSITKPNGQVLHFVGEYPSCLNTLYQMEMIRNTGLDSTERQRQREEFVVRLRALLASNDHTDSVRVVDYQDKDSFGNIISLSQILAPVVEEDRLPPSDISQ